MACLSGRDQGRGWSRGGTLGKKEGRVIDNRLLLDWRGLEVEVYQAWTWRSLQVLGEELSFWEPLRLLSRPLSFISVSPGAVHDTWLPLRMFAE